MSGSAGPAASAAPPDGRLAEATGCLHAGKPAEAMRLCRQVLSAMPGDAQAWELLGIAASAHGDPATAIEAFHRLVGIAPAHVAAQVNLGAVLASSGRFAEAAERFRAALRLAPAHRDAATFLVRALLAAGDADAAATEAQIALAAQPDNAGLRFESARIDLRRGKSAAAVAQLEAALASDPTHGPALLTLGRLLRANGRFETALDLARRAIAAGQEPATSHALAAELLTERGRIAEAETHAHAAIRHDAGSAEAQRAMALLLQRKDDRRGALAAWKEAIARAPQRADLHVALADLQSRMGDGDDALASLRRAVAIDGRNEEARTRLFVALRDICHWEEADALRPGIDAAVRRALDAANRPPEAPFVDVMLHEDLAHNLAVARGWAREVERRAEGMAGPKRRGGMSATSRPVLTVGYLSDELRDHPIGHHLAGLFARHDRSRVQTVAYSYGRDDGSEWARRAREGADRFVDISALRDEEAAARIEADGVDILVDLKGFTSNARLEILALRPAPIQASWLGFPGSYGARFMDYILSDAIVTPPEFQPHFDEALCLLPNSYQVNDDRIAIDPAPADRAAHGLPADGFVFCSFNKAFKIPPSLFDTWLAILDAVPGSCLWLWGRDARAADAMRERARRQGTDPARLVFAARVPLAQHLRRLALADLALDSMPYNGHATTSNALWAGVPVLAVLGRHFASRVSASLLTAAGLPEMVMPDRASYRRRAVELAQRPDELASLRARLRAARTTQPFFDTARFVRNLEQAYAQMWQRHVDGAKPATLVVEETP